jgi:hypothetical protein
MFANHWGGAGFADVLRRKHGGSGIEDELPSEFRSQIRLPEQSDVTAHLARPRPEPD